MSDTLPRTFADDLSGLSWPHDGSSALLLNSDTGLGCTSHAVPKPSMSDELFFHHVSSVPDEADPSYLSTSSGTVVTTLGPPASEALDRATTLSLEISVNSVGPLSVTCEGLPCTASAQSPARDIEAELRATIDGILKRKKDAQRGLVEDNASLRGEVAFLTNALQLSSAERIDESGVDSNKTQLAHALQHERTLRLRSEEKMRAVVEYLAEQITSVSERCHAAEKALKTSQHDCVLWRDKATAAITHGEVVEDENLRVKALLQMFAKHMPSNVQHQMHTLLRDIANERADLRRLEAIERSLEKLGGWHSQTHSV
ncbi:hypothetical protein BN946_scf184799.g61 [Trametes cinnabarina]|uniref:Uncharacterized protein n=1 Tax=Pycnoporus cinnabarinus TaxID=5643 RepID=A0A060S7V1_PYCCI|nr:hypothetical protein BN946_scf184799.g61 [Trametes cinnabarina]